MFWIMIKKKKQKSNNKSNQCGFSNPSALKLLFHVRMCAMYRLESVEKSSAVWTHYQLPMVQKVTSKTFSILLRYFLNDVFSLLSSDRFRMSANFGSRLSCGSRWSKSVGQQHKINKSLCPWQSPDRFCRHKQINFSNISTMCSEISALFKAIISSTFQVITYS